MQYRRPLLFYFFRFRSPLFFICSFLFSEALLFAKIKNLQSQRLFVRLGRSCLRKGMLYSRKNRWRQGILGTLCVFQGFFRIALLCWLHINSVGEVNFFLDFTRGRTPMEMCILGPFLPFMRCISLKLKSLAERN